MSKKAREQKKKKVLDAAAAKLNRGLEERLLSDSLKLNTDALRALFKDDDTLVTRGFVGGGGASLGFEIAYCEGLVDWETIHDSIIRPLMKYGATGEGSTVDAVSERVVTVSQVKRTDNFKDIIEAVTYGDTALFIEGESEALLLDTKCFHTRAVSEPESEKILKGPREGFNECLMANLSLLHRKLRTNKLKMKFMMLGRQTRTAVCLCYVEGIADPKLIKEVTARIGRIDIDGILDSNYVAELIRDAKFSPFRTVGTTERPDVVAGKVLEGRIAVLVDGSPVALSLPYLFMENFQSPEDYYVNYYYASFSRMLRIVAFILSVSVPALYVAVVSYHHEMLPTTLLINFAIERKSVPLPAALEAFLLLIMFDILKETGIRMPANIGQALSIVGALVIGQAAVDAKLIAAPMIIVVALTGITSLLVPRLSGALILSRYFLLVMGSVMGFFGLMTGFSLILTHVLSMKSLGVTQFSPMSSINFQDAKDTFIRAPWWSMLTRPKNVPNRTRQISQMGKGGKTGGGKPLGKGPDKGGSGDE